MVLAVGTAGDGGPSTEPLRRRGRGRRGAEAGSSGGGGAPPLSMTWPSGLALDWTERERIGHAALQRCSPQASASDRAGNEGRRPSRTPRLHTASLSL